MKTAEDFKISLGEAPPQFHQAIRQTLSDLTEKEARPMKKRRLYALIPAMLAIIMAVCAAEIGGILQSTPHPLNHPATQTPDAASLVLENPMELTHNSASTGWGILDFLAWWNRSPLPQAERMIENAVFSQNGGDTPSAAFRVSQAFHDGCRVYVVMDVISNLPDSLLLMAEEMDASASMDGQPIPYDYLSEGTWALGPDYDGKADSIRQYMAENSLSPQLIDFDIPIQKDASPIGDFMSTALMADGRMKIFFSILPDDTKAEWITLQIPCAAVDFNNRDQREETVLTLSLPTNQPLGKTHLDAPIYLKEQGITVESLSLQATPFGVEFICSYTRQQPIDGNEAMLQLSLRDGIGEKSWSFQGTNTYYREDRCILYHGGKKPENELPARLILTYEHQSILDIPLSWK